MANTLLKEKRFSSRIKLKRPLRYQVLGAPGYGETLTDNISLRGIGFVNNKFLSPESTVLLEFSIFARLLRAIGRVVWSMRLQHSERYQVGVVFNELEPQVKKEVTDYIEAQAVEP